MEEIGKFALKIELFREDELMIPKFESADFNMPKEILMAQLKAFLKKIEDSYNESFKGTTSTISGKPDQ